MVSTLGNPWRKNKDVPRTGHPGRSWSQPRGEPDGIMLAMLRIAAYVVLMICWIAWSLAFVKPRKSAAGKRKAVRAPASRWGILLVSLGFAGVWAFVQPNGFEKPAASLIASMIVGLPSVALAYAATRHLDKHWRFEAALSEDHELVRTGPYRWLRHPIYASMLGMVIQTGLVRAWWPNSSTPAATRVPRK